MKHILAFLGGALLGAGASLLFAPEKGVDTRARIKLLLKEKGIIADDDELQEIVEEINVELKK